MEYILDPWPWFIAGPLIALVLFIMLYFGKSFGFSSNLRHLCTIGGAGKVSDFFDYDWRTKKWSLLFLLGTVGGAFIASKYLMKNHIVDINPKTALALEELNIKSGIDSYVPAEIFDTAHIGSAKVLAILIIGGILIGFGTRWAGGCTSGHAITGLSNLQIPSLIATIGFFIGGLIMTHFLLPIIF